MNLSIKLNSLDTNTKLKENLLRSGVLRTTKFWYKSAKNNKLLSTFNINSEQAVNFATLIDQMFTVLNTHYPELWDVHINFCKTSSNNRTNNININNISIIIKYPEITIRNFRDITHVIKDLYVELPLILNVNNEIIVKRPEGTRGRVSFAEKKSSYAHSHLPSTSFSADSQYNTSQFCIGNGPLTDIFNRIEDTRMSIEDFEAILVFLDDFVKWESIEGVPYTYIDRISEVSTRSVMYMETVNFEHYINNTSISNLIDGFKENNIPLSFNYYKDRIVLNPQESFFNFVKDYIIEKMSSFSSVLLVYKGEDGKYYKYDISTNESASNTHNKYIIFRGQEYQFYIEAPTQDIVSINNYEVNPGYAKLLINELNDKIYENAVRKSIIEQQA